MSAQGDQNFIRQFRDRLAQVIESEKTSLVARPTERAAGHIQGLLDASSIMDDIIKVMTNPQGN